MPFEKKARHETEEAPPPEPKKSGRIDVPDHVLAAIKDAHEYVAKSVRKLGRKSPEEVRLLARLDAALEILY